MTELFNTNRDRGPVSGAEKLKYPNDSFKAIEKKEEEQVGKLWKIINRKKITVSSDALIRKSIKNISFIGRNEQDVLKRLIEVSLNRLLEKI